MHPAPPRFEHVFQDVPILQSLDAAERAKAVDALQPIKYPAGSAITKQGDQGDLFFIVEEGEVVVKKTDKNGNEAELARKIRGDYFGGTSGAKSGHAAGPRRGSRAALLGCAGGPRWWATLLGRAVGLRCLVAIRPYSWTANPR